MLGVPPNTIQDQVTTLNIHGFRGNDFAVILNVIGHVEMPGTVDCIVYHEGSKKPWPASLQPIAVVDGQSARIRFVNTDQLPERAVHSIRFNGRAVLSGTLIFDRQTIAVANSQELNLTMVNGNVVNVTVLVCASAGGGGSGSDILSLETSQAIPAGRLVASIGGKASLYDASVVSHAYTLVGVSTQSASSGGIVTIQAKGTVTIHGWGLTVGQVYRAGLSGNLSATRPVNGFSQLIGRAVAPDSFLFNPQPIIY